MQHDTKSPGTNLVKNGDFRYSLEHWTGRDLEVGTVAGLRGLRSNPNRLTSAKQQTGEEVTAGRTYRLQFKTIAENPAPNQTITIQLGYTINGTNNYPGLFTIQYDNQTWTMFSGTFVPEISGSLQANVYLINQSQTVRVYMTDIEIAEILTPLRRHARCLALRVRNLFRKSH